MGNNKKKEIMLNTCITFFRNIGKVFHDTIHVLEESHLVVTESYNATELFRKRML
jgi:hypothetical protein